MTATLDRAFHALSDPTRRSIVERLSLGPATVSQLAEPLDLTLAAVLQHVQVLEAGGLTTSAKTGRVRTCSVRPEGMRVVEDWFGTHRQLWERRFDRLGAVLDEQAQTDTRRKS